MAQNCHHQTSTQKKLTDERVLTRILECFISDSYRKYDWRHENGMAEVAALLPNLLNVILGHPLLLFWQAEAPFSHLLPGRKYPPIPTVVAEFVRLVVTSLKGNTLAAHPSATSSDVELRAVGRGGLLRRNHSH
ncbi:uncharacterized protein CIMG_12904 [Coccidioides immitis RS]|uniref:Uncharacterized protein n=1 Tax=Coccidioides immitis (strain RS) TaxID=246410 RepID=A0A0D8JTT1_COCIM|nr:uncharacterized protein CIMG_12904 [Coccidioides immitis RS]KJF60376.1 hypothetical protein CIMG_12904 [Coccidioides immitis RS]